jgi:hypothetical protein
MLLFEKKIEDFNISENDVISVKVSEVVKVLNYVIIKVICDLGSAFLLTF